MALANAGVLLAKVGVLVAGVSVFETLGLGVEFVACFPGLRLLSHIKRAQMRFRFKEDGWRVLLVLKVQNTLEGHTGTTVHYATMTGSHYELFKL